MSNFPKLWFLQPRCKHHQSIENYCKRFYNSRIPKIVNNTQDCESGKGMRVFDITCDVDSTQNSFLFCERYMAAEIVSENQFELTGGPTPHTVLKYLLV